MRRADPRPNIFVLLIDDAGLEFFDPYDFVTNTVGLNGLGKPDLTSFLVPLAQNGVKFETFRTMPQCSPTRASMLTGRYPFRTGVGSAVGEATGPGGEAWEFNVDTFRQESPYGKLLAPPGYSTLIAGKWHLSLSDAAADWEGTPPPSGQYGQGWDYIAQAAACDFRGTMRNLDKRPYPPAGANQPGYHNFYWHRSAGQSGAGTTVIDGVYHTIHTFQEIQNWITFRAQEPWCVWAAVSAAHSPFGTFPNNGAGFSGCAGPEAAQNSAPGTYDLTGTWGSTRNALEIVDTRMAALASNLGPAWDRTMVLACADNGTPKVVLGSTAGGAIDEGEPIVDPYLSVINSSRLKNTPYEAGVRCPLIVGGPLVRQGGRTSKAVIDCVDVHETIRHIGRTRLASSVPDGREQDGISFLPILQNPAAEAYHPRTFSLVEGFEPNSRPMDGGGSDVKDRGYTKWFEGEGWFKLVRRIGQADEFYQLTDDGGGAGPHDYTAVDPMEQADLGTGHANYTATVLEMLELLGTEQPA